MEFFVTVPLVKIVRNIFVFFISLESLNLKRLSQLQTLYIEQISIFPEKVLTLHEAKKLYPKIKRAANRMNFMINIYFICLFR
ncbi:hypothetical protein HR09_01440 [Porphyromonas gulae]|nr:hypothetical protein HR09_01440 [Porphyromonas gulae]